MRPEGWSSGLVPGLLLLACLCFGANHPLAAMGLTLLLALALCGALASNTLRGDLVRLRPFWPLAVLFAATLAVAGWTLTPLVPDGPHPIWGLANVSGASTLNRSATVLEIIKLLGLACAFLLGCLQGARPERAGATVKGVLALGALYALVALLAFLRGWLPLAGSRLTGGFLSPNSAATVFGMLAVMALAHFLRLARHRLANGWIDRTGGAALPLAGLLLFVACLLLTASRSGLVAAVAACLVLALWMRRRSAAFHSPALALMAGSAVTGGLLIAGALDRTWVRFEGLENDAALRGTIVSAHWRAFLDAPLFGHGLGSFSDVNSAIMTPETYGALWSVRASHNVYLQWLEEAGVVGAAPMFLLIGLVLTASARRVGRLKGGRATLKGLVAASLVVLVHGAADYALQVPAVAALWAFLLGLTFAFGQSRASPPVQAVRDFPYGSGRRSPERTPHVVQEERRTADG